MKIGDLFVIFIAIILIGLVVAACVYIGVVETILFLIFLAGVIIGFIGLVFILAAFMEWLEKHENEPVSMIFKRKKQ